MARLQRAGENSGDDVAFAFPPCGREFARDMIPLVGGKSEPSARASHQRIVRFQMIPRPLMGLTAGIEPEA